MCPTGKVTYSSKFDAVAHAIKLANHRGHKRLRAYRCNICKQYHLTRQAKRKEFRV